MLATGVASLLQIPLIILVSSHVPWAQRPEWQGKSGLLNARQTSPFCEAPDIGPQQRFSPRDASFA
jgi:hypothetical protein